MGKTNFNKIIFLMSLTITMTFSGCGILSNQESNLSVVQSSNLPVIKADDNHDFVNWHMGNTTPVVLQYEVTAGDGLKLDVSSYKIKLPPQDVGITHPNRIEVSVRFYGNDGIYKANIFYVDWKNDETVFELSAQTLIPLGHTEPFTGLQAGQEIGVAIVFFDKNGQVTGKEITYPLWGALVNVN